MTVVSTWDVRPGREADFEAWAHDLNEVAGRFPGHLGATWLRAEGRRHRYYTILNYLDEERLNVWLRSPERAERMRRVDGIARKGGQQDTTGLETWFSLPGESVPPPARWKMVLVTLAAVYPLSLLYQGVLAQLAQKLPVPVRAMAYPILMIPLLTYVIMPRLSRLLRRWLYPLGRSHAPARRSGPRRPAEQEDGQEGQEGQEDGRDGQEGREGRKDRETTTAGRPGQADQADQADRGGEGGEARPGR